MDDKNDVTDDLTSTVSFKQSPKATPPVILESSGSSSGKFNTKRFSIPSPIHTVVNNNTKSTSQKLSTWLMSKSILTPMTWCIMALTIYLGRKAFLAHVFMVTFLLLLILYNINGLYGRFDNPYYTYFITVLGGGIAHAIIPIIGTSLHIHIAMYIHLGFCFLVHIFHLSQCAYVFQDITFKDEEFILILWVVNIGEMIVNIVYVFANIFTSDVHYIACSLAVQSMALMIVNLHLKADSGGNKIMVSDDMMSSAKLSISQVNPNIVPNANEEETSNTIFSLAKLHNGFVEYITNTRIFIDEHIVSRTVLIMISTVSIPCMTLFPRWRYLVFMITVSIIMRLAVRKVYKACRSSPINVLLNIALVLAPICMIGFSLLTEFNILTHAVGTTLTLIAILWGMGLMFFALFTITGGQCNTVPIAFLMLIMSATTSILCLLQGKSVNHSNGSNEVLLFACLTISSSILFFLSKVHPIACAQNNAAIGAAFTPTATASTATTGTLNRVEKGLKPMVYGGNNILGSSGSAKIHVTAGLSCCVEDFRLDAFYSHPTPEVTNTTSSDEVVAFESRQEPVVTNLVMEDV